MFLGCLLLFLLLLLLLSNHFYYTSEFYNYTFKVYLVPSVSSEECLIKCNDRFFLHYFGTSSYISPFFYFKGNWRSTLNADMVLM